jgi:hypothetical protein
MWKPEPITLTWPIKHDDAHLEKLPLRPVTKAEYDKHVVPLENGTQQFLAMAVLATGLPEKVIKTLKRPDFNSLAAWLREMSGNNAEVFREISDPDAPELLVPITGDDGHQIDRVTLEVPGLEATILMEKKPNLEDQNWFINMHCTGLSREELGRLSLPDWNQIQARITRFLADTGDYFRGVTSTR